VSNSQLWFLLLTCYLVGKYTNISYACNLGNQLSLNTKQHASRTEADCMKSMYMEQASREPQLDTPLTSEGTHNNIILL